MYYKELMTAGLDQLSLPRECFVSYNSNEIMDDRRILEEQLRESACVGDTDAVQELINLGVDVNARHAINGWTPLHWACKRNYLDVVALLLKSGADKNVVSDKGETPASVCTNPGILQLLGAPPDFSKISCHVETPSFVPNYIKNAPLCSKLDLHSLRQTKVSSIANVNSNITSNIFQEELVLKIRIANSNDPDFIEVDLPQNSLTYQNLIKVCCDELGVDAGQILKLRKLPNTKIRRDKDIQRLVNFQEIEVVLISSLNVGNEIQHKSMQHANGSTVPITPMNNYQSISKKDQTILY